MNPDRFDVVVIAFAGLKVHGVVACHVKSDEAKNWKTSLRENLSRQFFMAVVPTGALVKGQQFEIPKRVRKSRVNHGMSTFQRRQADHVCVVCESPQLETRIYCASCLQKQNLRTRKYK